MTTVYQSFEDGSISVEIRANRFSDEFGDGYDNLQLFDLEVLGVRIDIHELSQKTRDAIADKVYDMEIGEWMEDE